MADAIVGPLGFASVAECVDFLLPRGAVLAENKALLVTTESVIQKPDRAQTNQAAASAAAGGAPAPTAALALVAGARFDVERNVAITHADFGLVA